MRIVKEGRYLGIFQLTKEMKEVKNYIEAVKFANEKISDKGGRGGSFLKTSNLERHHVSISCNQQQ